MSIKHADAPGFPWFHFEWHPGEHKGYVIRQPRDGSYQASLVATPFNEQINTEHEFFVAVQSFLMGYQMHADEPALYKGNGPKHRRLFAEAGRVGAKLNGL
jgi:hypothetical protein